MKKLAILGLCLAVVLAPACAQALSYSWTAFNDLWWDPAQSTDTNRVTVYSSPDIGSAGYTNFGGTAGPLRDYTTTNQLAATVTITGGERYDPLRGASAQSGTDADTAFGGFLDASGTIAYHSNDLVITFSNLEPLTAYEFVSYGDRGESGYAGERFTFMTITDAVSFVNQSSVGTEYTGSNDPLTIVCSGYNSDSGLVVRFTNIKPGTDGDFSVFAHFSGVGTDDQSKYYVNCFMLREVPEPLAMSIVGIGALLFALRRLKRR
ncbi:MAG: PEP-CTERM sorting domain-containing protein [Kiritimatiellae bacterium]|nr:PEP-CTERM sorting domain-containing protein [Kiritimatiellia bacterium]